MTYAEQIAVLRDKYVAAFQGLAIDKDANSETWMFLFCLWKKIEYLQTAEKSDLRDDVYHYVDEKLFITYYNYLEDNQYPFLLDAENTTVTYTSIEVVAPTVSIERIDPTTNLVLTSRYYSHFTTAFYWYINQLDNFSSGEKWMLAYRLWKLLAHLRNSHLNDTTPNEAYVDCMYGYFPDSIDYSEFANNSDDTTPQIQTPIIITEPPTPGIQNVFTKFEGDTGEIEADSIETTVTFNGNGINIIFDSLNKTITWDAVYDSYLPDGTTMPVSVGGHDAGTSVADLSGLTYNQMWDILLFPPQAPTATLSGTENKTLEVGTSISPILTAVFNQNGAGAQNSFSLEQDSVEVSVVNPYTATGLTSAIPAEFDFQAIFGYDAGAQILAGTINTNVVTYSFIYPIFYGISADNVVDVADIIAGTKVVSGDTTPTVTFGSDSSEYLWIAVPDTFADFTAWFVNQLNQGAIGTINDLFDAPTLVSVTSPNFTAIGYKLYVSNYSTESTDPMTFS